MLTLRTIVTDDTISYGSDQEWPSVEAAQQQGVRGALAIASEEVAKGKMFFAAEVLIKNGEEIVGRFVVSVGASRLK